MGFLDRIKKRPAHDDASIRKLLEAEGATGEQADQIVQILSGTLSPDEMHVWLTDRDKAHPVPDPESEAKWGTTLNWTPINAISAGKTELVIGEAKRFVGG